jgi:hypothetical protein
LTNNQSSIGNSKLKNVWHLQAQLVGAEDTAMCTMFNTKETTEGRRIEKVDAIAGTTTRYYYDDQRVAVQTLVSGSVETDDRYFVFGNYIDEVLLMHVIPAQAPNQDLYYGHDHLYPAVLYGPIGTAVERYGTSIANCVKYIADDLAKRDPIPKATKPQ